MKMRIKFLLLFVISALALWCTTTPGYGFDTELAFHGRIGTTAVLRDIDGVQYGLFDNNKWVGWKTELQFDLSITPKYQVRSPLRIYKVYLSYRGSYDAIYDLVNRYDDIPDSGRAWGGSRYDLGKDDLRSENDLREFFVDITLDAGENTQNCPQNAHLRLGRQIIQWGEADGFNLVNVVNPQDLRGIGAFAAPDDLANPIWLARLDLNSGAWGPFNNVSGQFLFIPDNRPTIWAPAGAPYGLGFPQNDHATGFNNPQYGARLGFLWQDLQTYLYYFNGWANDQAAGGLNLRDSQLDHQRYEMFGISFAKPWDWWKAVVRAEGSISQDLSFTDVGNLLSGGPGYSLHKTYKAYIGIDKPFHPKIGTDSALATTVQLYYQGIDGWDYDPNVRANLKKDSWMVTLSLGTDYYHGQINPSLFVWYDFTDGGSYLLSPSISYTPDYRWFFQVSGTAYMGDPHSASKFAPYIGGNDELAFKIKYQW